MSQLLKVSRANRRVGERTAGPALSCAARVTAAAWVVEGGTGAAHRYVGIGTTKIAPLVRKATTKVVSCDKKRDRVRMAVPCVPDPRLRLLAPGGEPYDVLPPYDF